MFVFVCVCTFLGSNLQTLRASWGPNTKGSGLRFLERCRHSADRLMFLKEALQKDTQGDPCSYVRRAVFALSLHHTTHLMLLEPAFLVHALNKASTSSFLTKLSSQGYFLLFLRARTHNAISHNSPAITLNSIQRL